MAPPVAWWATFKKRYRGVVQEQRAGRHASCDQWSGSQKPRRKHEVLDGERMNAPGVSISVMCLTGTATVSFHIMAPPAILARGIVYGALHDDGRWYIGSTNGTIDYRRHQHYADAHKGEWRTKFWDALLTSSEYAWTWGVHEEFVDITPAQLRAHEAQYQAAFNSIDAGFNTYAAARSDDERLELKRARRKARYAANKEDSNLRSKAYRETHKESIASKNKVWRAANKDKRAASGKRYYERHKERILKNRARRAAHRDPKAAGSK